MARRGIDRFRIESEDGTRKYRFDDGYLSLDLLDRAEISFIKKLTGDPPNYLDSPFSFVYVRVDKKRYDVCLQVMKNSEKRGIFEVDADLKKGTLILKPLSHFSDHPGCMDQYADVLSESPDI